MSFDTQSATPRQYERILARSQQLKFSMNSDVPTGTLLRTLATAKPGGSFLELGTGCGLGACWLLDGMSADAALVSVDTDPAAQAVARDELGDDVRLTLVLGDGGDYLERREMPFDLIYADAWPGKYTHFERALALLRPGGIYVIDDMLPQPNWPSDHGPRVEGLLASIDTLEGFAVTRLAWSTGVVLCAKRGA